MGASGFSGFRALGLSLISKPGPNRRSESLHLSNPIPIPQTPSPKPETSRREQTTSILSGLNERQVFGLTSSRTSRLGELKGSERLSIRFWGGVLPFPLWSIRFFPAPGKLECLGVRGSWFWGGQHRVRQLRLPEPHSYPLRPRHPGLRARGAQ